MSLTVKQKYQNHKACAKRRNIVFGLTFDEWYDIWLSSGKWEERGRGANAYCMCRYGDKGPYNKNNVYIATNADNGKEANTGRPQSDSKREKLSNIATGRKQSAHCIMKRAAALTGIKQEPERVAKRVASYIKTCNKRKETQGV
jgi:hypothetical protein